MDFVKYILGIGAITLLFARCSDDLFTQVVEVEVPPHDAAISIGADFFQLSNDLVRLQASKGIKEGGQLDNIMGASVFLKQGDDILKVYEDESLTNPDDAGYYRNTQGLQLNAGMTYTLAVEKEGFNDARATQVMPASVTISNIIFTEDGFVDPDGDRTDEISITFTDPSNSENYYGIKARVFINESNGEVIEENLFLRNRIDPLIEEGFDLNAVFTDGAFDGRDVTFDFSVGRSFKDVPEADSILLEFFQITRDKYLFERSLRIYDDSAFNPFVEPVIVHENVEGGHGIFSLSHVEEYTIDLN